MSIFAQKSGVDVSVSDAELLSLIKTTVEKSGKKGEAEAFCPPFFHSFPQLS